MLVYEKFQVEFEIGTYSDRILYDVMPVDVCHVLVGRPWKFNRKVIYDGRENTYTFEKDGRRHTLNPLKEEKLKE